VGQKHQAFREFRKPFPRATSANDVRVPHMMAQFVLKIGELSHIIGTAPMARANGLPDYGSCSRKRFASGKYIQVFGF